MDFVLLVGILLSAAVIFYNSYIVRYGLQNIDLSEDYFLMKKIAHLEKALNRTLDRGTILKIIEKYQQKGQIKKQYLKFDEELESFENSKMIQKEDI